MWLNVRWFLLFLAWVLLFGSYNNCSGVEFSPSNEATNSQGDAVPTPGQPDVEPVEEGLTGGHFDLDTATEIYELNDGSTDGHVHEYDDKHNVNYADFFNLAGNDLSNINDIIDNDDESFYIIIANAQLSKDAVLEINSQKISAVDYQAMVKKFIGGDSSALKKYSIDSLSIKLESFKVILPLNALKNNGLVPTKTSCVRKNQPGANGEYRNGALTIQAIAVDGGKIDSVTGVAAEGLLWESTIFWHKDGLKKCYGEE